MLGADVEEAREDRLIAGVSSRDDPSLNEHCVHTVVEKEVHRKDNVRI